MCVKIREVSRNYGASARNLCKIHTVLKVVCNRLLTCITDTAGKLMGLFQLNINFLWKIGFRKTADVRLTLKKKIKLDVNNDDHQSYSIANEIWHTPQYSEEILMYIVHNVHYVYCVDNTVST